MRRTKVKSEILRLLAEVACSQAKTDTTAQGFKVMAKELLETDGSEHTENEYADLGEYWRERYLKINNQDEIGLDNKFLKPLLNYVGYDDLVSFEFANSKQLKQSLIDKKTFVLRQARPLDSYDRNARILPSLLVFMLLIPAMYLLPFDKSFGMEAPLLLGVTWVVGGSTIVYALAQLAAMLSKRFERTSFRNRDGFPSTYLMLFKHHEYSDQFKEQFRKKIDSDFGLVGPSKEEEEANESESIKYLNAAARLILQNIHGGLLAQKLIQYGRARNSLGAVMIGQVLAAGVLNLGLVQNFDLPLLAASGVPLILYFILQVRLKHIFVIEAEDYARELISRYMQQSIKE